MADNKKGFILYADQKELFDQLPNDKAGELIKHIYSYVNDEHPKTNDALINLAFTSIKQQLKRDLDKWNKTREGRSKAGLASAEARRVKKLTNPTSVESVEQIPTKSTVKVKGKVNVNDTVNVKDIYRGFAHLCLTNKEYDSLRKDFSKEQIDNILDAIENFKHNTKYKSLNLTCRTWLKKEKNTPKKEKDSKGRYITDPESMENFVWDNKQ